VYLALTRVYLAHGYCARCFFTKTGGDPSIAIDADSTNLLLLYKQRTGGFRQTAEGMLGCK